MATPRQFRKSPRTNSSSFVRAQELFANKSSDIGGSSELLTAPLNHRVRARRHFKLCTPICSSGLVERLRLHTFSVKTVNRLQIISGEHLRLQHSTSSLVFPYHLYGMRLR